MRVFATALVALALIAASLFECGTAAAQSPAGILTPGNAVVTGFSGAPPPQQIAPGADPGDTTFIDLNGPSLRVFSLQAPGAPPQAQVIPSPPTFTVTASQIGQVFGVALDNASPPNIYAAATSAYGLPIVAPGQGQGAGGTLARVHQGAPGTTFMPGLFGPAGQGGFMAKLVGGAPNGGPGSIWRIDGKTGAVSLFANVTTNGAANSGAALGGLAFDPASNALFVADRQTGIIHRFNLSGAEIGTYDHGTQGLPAAGLPPVPYTPRHVDITSSQFNSDVPSTWGYAPPQRLIFGLAVHQGRLYYAVAAGLQVWSVGLAPNGGFGSDARLELEVPTGEGPTEISKIAFDDRGDMFLAERGAPTGDYSLVEVAEPSIGSVLRYAPTFNGWQPAPDQYAIGFPQAMTNANGGVALGYGYDANGNIDRAVCNGFVWSTGENLRAAADPATANALAGLGVLDLNGLQGNSADLIVPENAPPLQSYFLDYAPPLDDPAVRGHMGDIAIPVVCPHAAAVPALPPVPLAQMLPPGLLPPGLPPGYIPPPLPPSYIPPGSSCTPGTSQVCCPIYTLPGAGGQCQTMCPLGQSDPTSETYCFVGLSPVADANGNTACLNNVSISPPIPFPPTGSAAQTAVAACASQSPFANQANCPTGWTLQPNSMAGGVPICAPPPSCANGSCSCSGPSGPGLPYQVTQCCPNGMTPQPNGVCPQQACQGPNCSSQQQSCQGPNCSSQQQSCQGPNCPSQQQSGCSPAPGTICCPANFVLNKSGTCQPLCPNGLTDPTSELLCSSGVNPTPVNGQYVCLDGTTITGPQPVVTSSGGVKNLISNCTAQSPFANTSFCPLNQAPTPPSPPIPGVTTFCVPTGQQASSSCPGSDIAYPVTSAQSQQLPQCPPGGSTVPNCQGPNCSSQQQSCQGPNCPSQQQPCQGPNCSMPNTPPSGSLCPQNTLEQPGFTCCPHGFVRASSGVCKPLCPGGQTDPASFQKCRLGFDPMPTATGVYRCLDGSTPNPPSNPLGCMKASPLTNPANCPHGAAFGPSSQTGGVPVCQETALMKTCAAQGMQVGLDGQTCANDCPNGGYPYSAIQCCPNGETPGNDGQCPGTVTPTQPPTSTPPSPSCGSNQTLFCQPNQNGSCPTGTTYNDSKCLPTAPNTSCGSNVASICCSTNASPNFTTNPPSCVPNQPGTGTNTTPGPSNCASGTNLYCAANTDGSCPVGSQAFGYNTCVSYTGGCQTNFQWCCPGDELPDPTNVGSCCQPGTVPSAKGCLPAGKPQTPTPSQPQSACTSGGGPLICPPQGVCANGGQPAGNGGCCPAGTTPGAGGCVLAAGVTTCPSGGQPLCCTGLAQPNFAIGQCCPIGEFASGSACLCAGRFDVNGVCCPSQLDQNGACDSLGSASASKPSGCPPGTVPGRDRDHACIQCPTGYAPNANQTMCQRTSTGPAPTIVVVPVQSPQSCRRDEIPTANGCVPFRGIPIPPASTTIITSPTTGVPAKVVPSTPTQTQIAIPSIPTTQIPCLPNQIRNDRGRCIAKPVCHDGLVPGPDGGCVRPQANRTNTPSNAQPTNKEKCHDGMVEGPNGCVREERKSEKPSTPLREPRRIEVAPKVQLPRAPAVSRPLKPLTFTRPPKLNMPAFKLPGRK